MSPVRRPAGTPPAAQTLHLPTPDHVHLPPLPVDHEVIAGLAPKTCDNFMINAGNGEGGGGAGLVGSDGYGQSWAYAVDEPGQLRQYLTGQAT